MRTLDQQLRYEQLELLSHPLHSTPLTPVHISGITSYLRRISHHITRWLTQGNEPKIWVKQTRSGQKHWHVYDPKTRQRVVVSSEKEVCFWLESRYKN